MDCRWCTWLEARSRSICPACFHAENTCKSLSFVRFTTHWKLWNCGLVGKRDMSRPSLSSIPWLTTAFGENIAIFTLTASDLFSGKLMNLCNPIDLWENPRWLWVHTYHECVCIWICFFLTIWVLFIYHFYYCTGTTLWRLQKFLQYIIVEFTPRHHSPLSLLPPFLE
jgi:hypothetical protein